MATVKELIQSFCYRMNLPAPSAFVGVSSPNEQQLLSIFQSVGDSLRNRPFDWPQLKRGYTFLTVTNQVRYRLPGDFYRLCDNTQWDTTNNLSLYGPMSDSRQTERQYSVEGITTRKSYRIIGPTGHLFSTSPFSQRSAGDFEIDPAGANNTDVLFLQYISCNWIWPRDWVASTAYSLGDVRSVDRYIYICTSAGTSSTTRPSTSTVATDITDGTVTWRVYNEPYLCNPANTKLNDSDLCLFDDDIMIDGMRWAYKQAKGQDFQQLRADWEDSIKGANARFEGIVRGNMATGYDGDEDWPLMPEGGWSV